MSNISEAHKISCKVRRRKRRNTSHRTARRRQVKNHKGEKSSQTHKAGGCKWPKCFLAIKDWKDESGTELTRNTTQIQAKQRPIPTCAFWIHFSQSSWLHKEIRRVDDCFLVNIRAVYFSTITDTTTTTQYLLNILFEVNRICFSLQSSF